MAYMCGLIDQEQINEDPHLRADLEKILRAIPSYIDICMEEIKKLIKEFRMRQTMKQLTGHNILGLIQFSQNLMQFGWVLKDPFMQFPNVTPPDCEKLHSILGESFTIYKYAMMEKQKRKEVIDQVFPNWTPEQYEEHEKVVSCLPLIKCYIECEVAGQDTPRVGDLLKTKVRVEFLNLKQGQQSGYVHSRTYPFLRRENWYLIITEASMTGIASVNKLPIEDNVYEKTFDEQLHRPGPIDFVCIVANDSYKGLDVMATKVIEVMDPDPLGGEDKYHEEDMEFYNELKKKEKEEEEHIDTDAEDSDPEKPDEEKDE